MKFRSRNLVNRCRFTLAILYVPGNLGLPFYLVIDDKLFGTCRISHRIGGLFVAYGGSILGYGYLGLRTMLRGMIDPGDAARLGVAGRSGSVRDITIRSSSVCVWSG